MCHICAEGFLDSELPKLPQISHTRNNRNLVQLKEMDNLLLPFKCYSRDI